MVTTIGTYRDSNTNRNIILDMAQKKHQIVHGQQSINVQTPKHLNRKTKDYDIYTSKPKENAEELMNKLNKEYHKDKFTVVEGKHKGTFKVKSGKDTIADYTLEKNKPKSKKILGVSYSSLEYQKGKLKSMLKNKDLEFRHAKDTDTLDKINKAEMGGFLIN